MPPRFRSAMSSARPAFTWTCPVCKRRVPSRVTTCHCGATRTQAALPERAGASPLVARPRPARPGPGLIRHWRSLGLRWDFWVSVVVLFLAMLVGVWRLFQPYTPSTILPLLGYVDPPRPAPTAIPTKPPR
jgi:hypothetical protein